MIKVDFIDLAHEAGAKFGKHSNQLLFDLKAMKMFALLHPVQQNINLKEYLVSDINILHMAGIAKENSILLDSLPYTSFTREEVEKFYNLIEKHLIEVAK